MCCFSAFAYMLHRVILEEGIRSSQNGAKVRPPNVIEVYLVVTRAD
jgi:hypothetical protein